MICGIFTRRWGQGAASINAESSTEAPKAFYFSEDETDSHTESHLKPSRAQKHPDRSRRRRSANADILESVGLPPTVSYHDMKSLQDGLSIDDILGRRFTCGGCLKEAAATIGCNTHRAAQRASRSAARLARWSRRISSPAIDKRLRKEMPDEDSWSFRLRAKSASCPSYYEQHRAEKIMSQETGKLGMREWARSEPNSVLGGDRRLICAPRPVVATTKSSDRRRE